MRKRTVLLSLALSLAVNAFSQGFVLDGFYYEVNSVADKTLSLVWAGGNCKGDVVLPESVTYNGVAYKISNIDDRAFSGCDGMTSIVIPEGVIRIGDEAFRDCSGLQSISFPNSIAEIASYYPFSGCYNLSSVNNYTTITYNSFYGNNWYNDKYNEWYDNLPDGIIRIGNVLAGYKGTMPDSIVLPDGVTHIWPGAFRDHYELLSVTIPASVTNIGENAFYNCSNLSSIEVLGNLDKIGRDAFRNTAWYDYLPNGLAIIANAVIGYKGVISDTIVIPDGITYIGEYAFADNRDFSAVSLPASLMKLGEHAFSDGYARSILSSISLPQGLEEIGNCAFWGCTYLTSLVIPESVRKIGSGAFQSCHNLSSINIPSGVSYIRDDVFSECDNLTAIVIPKGVISIGEDAFEKCYSLSSVTIPESVLRIGPRAFYYCKGMNSIALSEGIKQIEVAAFTGCSELTSIEIPASVEQIDDSFAECGNLKSIVVSDGNKFYDSRENCNALIETATGTLLLGCSNTVIPNSISSIGFCAFYGCYNLTGITIPENITSIDIGAFQGCTGLVSMVLPNSITKIEENVFSMCTNLTSITIPNSVDSIETRAFYGCTNLTSLTVPESVKHIGKECFAYCNQIRTLNWGTECPLYEVFSYRYNILDSLRNLTFGKGVKEIEDDLLAKLSIRNPHLETVTISDGITRIGNGSLSYTNISSIFIPSSVKEIGDKAFSHCSYLTDVTISKGVTSIGKQSFSYCSSLTSITIPESVSVIGREAFYGCEELKDVLFKGGTQIGVNAFFDCPDIEHVFCTNPTPGKMELHNPLIGGETESVRIIEGSNFGNYIYELYDSTLMRTVTKVSAREIEINMSNVPKGKYRVSVGILPNLDSISNSMHPIISGYTDYMEEVLFDSMTIEIGPRGRLIKTPYMISNNDYFRYDTIFIDDFMFEECIGCEYGSVLILDTLVVDKDYKGLIISLSSITGTHLLLDRIFLEKLDGEIAETCFGPFSESVFNTATLYVPACAVDSYRIAEGWRLFKNIVVDTTVYPDDEIEVAIGGAGYATFYNSLGSYLLPQGLSAMVVSGMSDDKLVYETIASGSDNGVIPAGVPVILMSDNKSAGTYKLQYVYGSYEYSGSNLLKGSDVDTQTYADGDCRFYKLAYGPDGTDLKDVIGWYWGAADGGAFSIEAHKAWLALPMSRTKGMAGFSLLGDTTYVFDVEAPGKDHENIVYDMYGRRLSAPTGSGLYIINGKKVIITE